MAYEVNIPFGLMLPTGTQPVMAPMYEHEVQYDKPKPKKTSTKKTVQLPVAPARPTPPGLISDGRGFQSVNPPQPTATETGTGKGYTGPFVADREEPEEQPTPTKERDGLIPRRTIVGGTPATTEETFLSNLIKPPEGELEAARNGMRWHWALQNRWMLPGSKWNETVWNGVDRENQYIAQLLKQKKGEDLNLGIPTAAEIRAREMYRGKVMDQYNKALAEYMKGHYDDPERAYEDFKKEVERLRGQYAKAGEVYGMDAFDPEDLRIPPPIAAPRNAGATAPKMFDLSKERDFAAGVVDELKSWIADGRINDREFMQGQQAAAYLDSVYERLMKAIKASSNTMADAEKQRMQILLLPDDALAMVQDAILDYQDKLAMAMASSSAKEWSQNNRGKVNEIINDLGFNPKSMDKASLASAMEALGGTLTKAMSSKDELPHDVATDVQALKEQFDTYMKNMMLAANVAPHIVANMAANVGKFNSAIYNNQAFRAGRMGADYLKPIEDISAVIPKNAMPIDRLLKNPPKFIAPTLNVRGKIDNTGNPQTGKEGSGDYIYDDEGGLK